MRNGKATAMKHRHLQEQSELSSAAIDDIIERGGWEDWLALRDRTETDRPTAERVLRVCEARGGDPYAQRHRLWRIYAKQTLA